MSPDTNPHYEEALQKDVAHIRGQVRRMGQLCENAIRQCVEALRTRDRKLAYSIIIRDQWIDQLEKEIDQLCLEFVVRRQPVASLLRFAYGTIRVNLELERVGDYAESIAHQLLKLKNARVPIPVERYEAIATLSIRMLHESVEAFVKQDAELARRATAAEATVDMMKRDLNRDLVALFRENQMSFEELNALMMATRRFERVSDQASNICGEALYMCTGEYARHVGAEAFHVLFVDRYNAGASQMAEAIGKALNQPKFVFASAGTEPRPMDPRMADWMTAKGLDVSHAVPRAVTEVANLASFPIVIPLDPVARKNFPPYTHKITFIEWGVQDPATATGSAEEMQAACEKAYTFLTEQITDLVNAILTEGTE